MNEDVLEQIVDDYLQFKGYFTIHNVRFKPYHGHEDYVPDQDRVSSDVDVVGYRPTGPTNDRVIVVSCKVVANRVQSEKEAHRTSGRRWSS